jgi:hypothetical protein
MEPEEDPVSAAERAEQQPEVRTQATPLPIVVTGESATDPSLIEAVHEDWTNLSERSVPLTSVDLSVDEGDERSASPAAANDYSSISDVIDESEGAPRRAIALPGLSGSRWMTAGAVVLVLGAGIAGISAALRPDTSTDLPPVESSRATEGTGAADSRRQPPAPALARETRPPTAGPDQPATASAAPAAPARTFTVNINANPYAFVQIDGGPAKETPIGELPVAEGEHVFRARMPNGEVKEQRVFIDRDGIRVLFD